MEIRMPITGKALTVKDAAERLGVTPQTLRNWVAAGKLPARRHPINGYRLFDPTDIDYLASMTSLGSDANRPGGDEVGSPLSVHDASQLELSYGREIDSDSTWLRSPTRRKVVATSKRKIRIGDAFCGGGIFSLGIDRALSSAGFAPEHVFGIDFEASAIATFSHNFQESRAIHADVLTIANGEFGAEPNRNEREFAKSTGDIDILVGGPPCQGHSDLNNHTRRIDPKNELYFSMVRLAELLRPKLVIVENVPGVLHDSGRVVERTEEALRALDYQVSRAVVELEKVGVPQKRKRLALIASAGATLDLSAAISRGSTLPRPISWALDDLLGEYDDTSIFSSSAKHSTENQRRINFLFQNDLYDLPNEQRPPCHRDKEHSYVSVYGRMKWDAPAPTITGGFGSTGQGRFVHPLLPRTLTPHEACRLQFVPDFFTFPAGVKRRAMQQIIGNAAPPKLGEVIVTQAILQGLIQ